MKPAMRLIVAALILFVAAGVFTASVSTQDRGRGPTRIAATDSQEIRGLDRALERMERDGDLVLKRTQADSMEPARSYRRLEQRHLGVPVWGAEVVREIDRESTVSLTGTLYRGVDVDPEPTLSALQAAAIFAREVPKAQVSRLQPELVIYPRPDGTFVLTYLVTQFVGGRLPVVFVNATNGSIEHRYENLQTQEASVGQGKGVFGDDKKISASAQSGGYLTWDRLRPTPVYTLDLKGNPLRLIDIQNPGALPIYTSDLAFSSANTWTDGPVVDAHVYVGWSYDFFYKRFGWKGLDNNNGRAVYAIVHPIARKDFDTWHRSLYWADVADYYVNSSFCPGCGYRGADLVTLGEGLPAGWTLDGQIVDYAAGSIDTVSHEYAHGVTSYSSNLIYQNESGALNEAFSDVMSDSVEWYYQTPGTGIMKADYVHGEDSHRPSAPGSASGIRSLANPSAYDCSLDRRASCPDHYSLRYTGRLDGGGVHVNSSIVNHAFYLAIEGGTNRVSRVLVQGVGAANRIQIERSFFRAFTSLPMSATFSVSRARTIAVAQELYGSGSAAERAITQAWSAVGVF